MANIANNNSIKMTEQEIKNKIADILNIENSTAWDVIDKDEDAGLYLVHHRPEADPIKYGHIRGIVVDINNKITICKSYKYTPTVISNELKLETPLEVEIMDTDGYIHKFDKSRLFGIKVQYRYIYQRSIYII